MLTATERTKEGRGQKTSALIVSRDERKQQTSAAAASKVRRASSLPPKTKREASPLDRTRRTMDVPRSVPSLPKMLFAFSLGSEPYFVPRIIVLKSESTVVRTWLAMEADWGC